MCYLACLFVVLAIPAVTLATDEPRFSPAEQEVLNVSQARRDASNRRDVAGSARYVAADCIFSSDDGVVITKAKYYERLAKLPVAYDRSTNAREFVVRLHGDTAVINFRITAHEQFGDADIISEQRRTETWLKEKGSWVLIALQWDNLPVNFRKPVSLESKAYKDYVGQYEWRPGDDIETVYLKDGKLWTQQGDDVDEYLPAGRDMFFLRQSDLATFAFSRDAQGRVIGYIYHRIDGQEIHVKKIQ